MSARTPQVNLFIDGLRRAISTVPEPRSGREQLGVALYVDLVTDTEDAHDDLLWGLAHQLDDVEPLVLECGLEVPIRTATTLLAVQTLPQDTEAASVVTEGVLALAQRVLTQLRLHAQPSVAARVCVHVDCASRRVTAAGAHEWTGRLLEVGRWVPDREARRAPADLAGNPHASRP